MITIDGKPYRAVTSEARIAYHVKQILLSRNERDELLHRIMLAVERVYASKESNARAAAK